jgi:hypothetical protein
LPTNVRMLRKGLTTTNNLAYQDIKIIKTVKRLILLATIVKCYATFLFCH